VTGTGLRYDNLRALFINGTLKRSPERSNTDGLIERSRRHPGAREPAFGVGRRLPVRLRNPDYR